MRQGWLDLPRPINMGDRFKNNGFNSMYTFDNLGVTLALALSILISFSILAQRVSVSVSALDV